MVHSNRDPEMKGAWEGEAPDFTSVVRAQAVLAGALMEGCSVAPGLSKPRLFLCFVL